MFEHLLHSSPRNYSRDIPPPHGHSSPPSSRPRRNTGRHFPPRVAALTWRAIALPRRPRHHEGRGAGERHSAPACATHPASVGRGHLALGARLPRHPPRGWRWPPPSFLRIVATGEGENVALVQHKRTACTVRSRAVPSRTHGAHRAPGRKRGSTCALDPRKCPQFCAPRRRWPWRGPI